MIRNSGQDSILKTMIPKVVPQRKHYLWTVSSVSVDLYLTELIPTNAYKLPSKQFYSETLIYLYDNETVSSGSSGGLYSNYVCADSVSSVYISPLTVNGKNGTHDLHDPTIIENEIEVDEGELIFEVKQESFEK